MAKKHSTSSQQSLKQARGTTRLPAKHTLSAVSKQPKSSPKRTRSALPGDQLDKLGRRRRENRRIYVRPEHIDLAVVADSKHCMIAEAIRQQVPKAANIAVDLQSIRWSNRKKRVRYTFLTPRIAQEALVRFDRGNRPSPFHFTLKGAIITQTQTDRVRNGQIRRRIVHAGARSRGDIEYGRTVVVGGRPPRSHHASRTRQFGMKRFTWD